VPAAAPPTSGPWRDELWVVIVLLVIVVLLIEWLVYHRDAVTRLWRGVRRTAVARPGDGNRGGGSRGARLRRRERHREERRAR
jgi:hypothetical protein